MNHLPNHPDHWYHQIPWQDRQTVDAMAAWLRPIPWQWFVTLTFPWNVSQQTALERFHAWINHLEREVRHRIGFVAGMERKPLSHGLRVSWHFHLLLVAQVPIPRELMEPTWRGLVGAGTRRQIDGRELGDSILVEGYDRELRGIEYALKSMNSCHGNWLMRWIEFFLPGQRGTARPNARRLRARRRFLRQRADHPRHSVQS